MFPFTSGTREGCPLSPLLFKIALEILSAAIRQEGIKGIRIRKEEVKLSLFANDMILHLENHKDSTRKLLRMLNELSKVVRYKINIQKSVAFNYTYNELSERETKKTIPLTIAPKKKKIPRNKFNQGCK